MVFKPRQKRQNLNIKLEISNCATERVRDTLFLGVILEENLTWKQHIANVGRKILFLNQAFVFLLLLYVLFIIV